MTDYSKQTKLRVQVMLDQARHKQLSDLADLTGSSISRIVRLALDSKADEFDRAISKAREAEKQSDLYRPPPKPKPAPKPQPNISSERKKLTDESFKALVARTNKK